MAAPISRVINAPLRTRRLIALLLFLAILAAVATSSWIAVSSLIGLRADVLEKRETVGRLQAIAALKPLLVQESNTALPTEREDFLEGDSEAVVRGNMQTRLTAMVGERNVNLLSASNVPDLNIDGARYVGIRADLSGTVDAVHNAIFAIETSKPLIIREASIWLSGPDQLPGATQAPHISVQIRLYGALRQDFKAPEKKAAP
ncbi:type II secretion system protein GspM [Mesorhizobium sp. ZC-5]|uniref:type II secretion system protein GspM n=1 Tax=Mesorhizobium sp. ZC-5 TaxID=2986066 RepID=UPI0021E927B6|nr:type II secretion system protein GspM [Mesorhizobium sp. ZC-5]MCV3243105.1 type II secretion system protein GspM [Mesorhizobium sp. ZC-5]